MLLAQFTHRLQWIPLLLLLAGNTTVHEVTAFSFPNNHSAKNNYHPSSSSSSSSSTARSVVTIPGKHSSLQKQDVVRTSIPLSVPTTTATLHSRRHHYATSTLHAGAGGFEWIDPTEEDNLNDPGVANPYKNPSLISATANDSNDNEQQPTSLVVDPARLLAPRLRGCNIYLIGMMGSGKSAVGDAIARRMGTYNFLDTDTILERAAGTTIQQMFDSSGEDEFRIAEAQVLDAVHAHVRLVIATGGGIVIRNQNWSKLRTGLVVYLRVEPTVIADRLLKGNGVDARPLLRSNAGDGTTTTTTSTTTSGGSHNNDDEEEGEVVVVVDESMALIQRLTNLISERRNKYEQADVIVDVTSTMNLQNTADAVIKSLHDFIDDNPPAYVKAREKARSEGIDWV